MRSIIRSTGQLSELRAAIRVDVAFEGDDRSFVDDFITAVNEVVAAALSNMGSTTTSVEVRWSRRTAPQAELWAEIRNASEAPDVLLSDGIVSQLLRRTAERLDVQERIGGSVITIRSRI